MADAKKKQTTEAPSDEFLRDVYLDGYEEIRSEIRGLQRSQVRSIGLGVSLIALGLGAALRYEMPILLGLVPFGIVFLSFFQLFVFYRNASMGGYASYLEKRINELCQEEALQWERIANEQGQRMNLASYALAVLVILTGLGTGALALYTTDWGWGLSGVYGGSLVIFSAVGVYVLVEAERMWGRVRRGCLEEHGRAEPQRTSRGPG